MSYSNPTWYGVGDPMAAQKAFQKSFSEVYSSAENFFAEVDNQVKQDEATLQKQAQEMRKQLSSAKRAVPHTKAQINELVRTFYEENKPSRIDDGGSFLKRVYTTRSSGINKAKLDEAQSNFKGYSDNINLFTEFALSEKYNDKTTDKGNALYLPLMQAKAAYAKDPSSLKSEYKDGEFKFYVEYGEGKRMDMDELSAGIQGLDPSIRQGIDNEKNAFIKRTAGVTKTMIDAEYEMDRAAGITGVVHGPATVARGVEKDLRLKVSSSEEGSNFVQDQFNNNVKIGPKAKAEIFKTVTIDGEKDEVFNGANLLESINEIKDPSKRAKALDAFNLILDVPIKDKENINRLSKIMRDAGADGFDLDYINEGLEEFQLRAVGRQLTNDVLATGVDSKYIAPPKAASGVSSKTNNYKRTKTQKEINIDEGSANAVSRLWVTMGDNKTLGFSKGYIDPGKIMTSSGKRKDVSNTRYDSSTNTFTVEWPSGKDYDKKTYNLNNPKEMRALYKDFAFNRFDEKGWEKSTIESIEQQGYAPLNRDNMQEWVAWIEEKGTKQDVQNMKIFLVQNVLPSGSTSSIVKTTWSNFLNKYKEEIDDMYTEYRQSKTN